MTGIYYTVDALTKAGYSRNDIGTPNRNPFAGRKNDDAFAAVQDRSRTLLAKN